MQKHLAHSQRFRHQTRMLPTRAAKAAQRILTHIIAALHRNLFDRVCHVFDGNADETFGDLFGSEASAALSQHGEFFSHYRHIQRFIAFASEDVWKIIRLQLAQQQMGDFADNGGGVSGMLDGVGAAATTVGNVLTVGVSAPLIGIGTKAVTMPVDAQSAHRVEQQLRDFIRGGVSDALTRARAESPNLTPERIQTFVDTVYESAFAILQTLGDAEANQ